MNGAGMIIESDTFNDEMDVTVYVFGEKVEIRCEYVWDRRQKQLDGYPDMYYLNEDNEHVEIDEATRDEIDIQDVADKITNEITGADYV